MRKIIKSGRLKKVLSTTTGNGSEFPGHPAWTGLLASLNREVNLYHTHACAFWKKGTVENANRIVRRWYPKGTDPAHVSHSQIAAPVQFINSIARKTSLKGKTSYEVFSVASKIFVTF